MKMLRPGDGRVVKIIQNTSVKPEETLRLSRFVFPFETKDKVLLKHTLSKQVCCLSREEWSALQRGTLPEDMRNELAVLRFLVEVDYDEVSQYSLVLSILRIMEKKKTGIESYTILPTTGCNARCVYCYEEGWQTESMTPETADAAADFIFRTKCEGKICLNWFGGEPLCCAETISRICRNLRDRGVEYYSTIITNGTMLTPRMADEAAGLWNLQRAQISMDGARADYEQRKNYYRPDIYNYDSAMNAVHLLSDAGVRVILRCNYDAGNLDGTKEFFEDCKIRFGDRDNVSVYLEQLFQATDAAKNAALFRAAARKAEYLDELGLTSTERPEKRLKTYYCMADSRGRSVIISPAGGLYVCEHLMQGKPIGTVFDQMVSWPAIVEEIAEECRGCCFLPECTPFRKSGCPLRIAACKTQREVWTERSLQALLARREANEKEEDAEGECP